MISIHLERVDPERNCFRYYGIFVEENLFGDRSLVIRWGRIGRIARERIAASGSAEQMLARAVKLQVTKCRRGYAAMA